MSASTDAGDVSWTLPMAALGAATFVPGVPAHSWQAAACAGMSIGRKGMVVAAKSLVLTAIDLYTEPNQVEAAKASFEKRRAGYGYGSYSSRSQAAADIPRQQVTRTQVGTSLATSPLRASPGTECIDESNSINLKTPLYFSRLMPFRWLVAFRTNDIKTQLRCGSVSVADTIHCFSII